jgi:hypothetical protein
VKEERFASQAAPSRAANPAVGPLHRSVHLARLRRAAGSRRADLEPGETPPDRGPPHAVVSPLRDLLACPVAEPCAVVLVSERLSAQHTALLVWRTATGRPLRRLGRLPDRGEGAGDERGILDQPEQLHPPLALGAGENVHREGSGQKVSPRAVGARVSRRDRLVAHVGGLGHLWCETRPPRARRGQHSRVLHGVEARRGHAGGETAQQRQRIHVHRDRPSV